MFCSSSSFRVPCYVNKVWHGLKMEIVGYIFKITSRFQNFAKLSNPILINHISCNNEQNFNKCLNVSYLFKLLYGVTPTLKRFLNASPLHKFLEVLLYSNQMPILTKFSRKNDLQNDDNLFEEFH